MPTSIEEIALRLHDAECHGFLEGRLALHALLADEVELHRVPAWPGDGMRSKESFLANWRAEAQAFDVAFLSVHQDDVRATTEGERITLVRTLCPTTHDGRTERFTFTNVITVRDGTVVAMEVHIDAATRDALQAIIRESGAAHADVPTGDER